MNLQSEIHSSVYRFVFQESPPAAFYNNEQEAKAALQGMRSKRTLFSCPNYPESGKECQAVKQK